MATENESKLELDNHLVEVDADEGEDIEVVVVDDVPPEDRGRTPLPYDPTSPKHAAKDESLSEAAKQRARELTKAVHDERRAREAVERENAELQRIVEANFKRATLAEQRLAAGEKVVVDSVKASTTTEIKALENELARAIEAGKSEEVARLQVKLSEASAKKVQMDAYVPQVQPQQQRQPLTQQQPAPARPAPTQKVQEWATKNADWFHKDADMTDWAMTTHRRIIAQGVKPDTDEYFEKLDKSMKLMYPDYPAWKEDEGDTTAQTPAPTPAQKKPAAEAPSVSGRSQAAASQSKQRGGKTTVTLTSTQVAIAKKLGLTPQQYAVELVKVNQQGN